jgi:hypothetical protein
MGQTSSTEGGNLLDHKTLYLPKIKELQSGFDQSAQRLQVGQQQIFDNLFYKRLQHIERVLDEDPMELEKFKNYF